LPSGNLSRTLRYLEAIDEGGGSATRMDFYVIAGNEDNLRRWEQKLCEEWKLAVKFEEGGRIQYRKTDLGENLHKLLKNHDYVGSLFEELIRDRLRPT
jgi:hypothetical protein